MSLGEMHMRGWQLRGTCRSCGLELFLPLPELIRLHGPDAIGWGVEPRCRRWGCANRMKVWARSIKSGSWVCLSQRPDRETIKKWQEARSVAAQVLKS